MESHLTNSATEWTEEDHLLFYQFTLENMSDAAYWLTSDGGFAYVNNAACKMLGYTKSEFYKLRVADFIPPNHMWDWEAFWLKLKEAKFMNFESNHLNKSGEPVTVEVRSTYISFRGKEFAYSLVSDIRERKYKDEKLKESERRLTLFLENNMDAFLLTAPDGRIFYVNPAACRMFDRTAEEICALGRAGILDLSDPRLVPALEERARTGLLRAELTGKRKNGDTFPIDVSSSYYHTDEGELRTSMVLRDITERKKADLLLRESEARLAELNATKDKFFSIISHDLRNPVHNLLGTIQILREDIDKMDKDTIRKFTMNLNSSAGKLDELIDNLLKWALLQMGQVRFNPESLQLKQMIDFSLIIVKDTANRKNISFNVDISEELFVIADREMVGSILQNLFTNGIKFSHPESEISVSAQLKGTEVEVVIADSGVGIEEEVLEKLFRIDSKYHTAGTQNEIGTGLGLILCKEFIEKLSGTIRVESKVGVGSRFIFTLPAAPF